MAVDTTTNRSPRGQTRRQVLALVLGSPGCSTTALADMIGLSLQTTLYHLRGLASEQLVTDRRRVRTQHWFPYDKAPSPRRDTTPALTGTLDQQRVAIIADLQAELTRAEATLARQAARIALLERELATAGNGRLVPLQRRARA
jgi:predicted transcriptional regulator